MLNTIDNEYRVLLKEIKDRIRGSQIKAALSVNKEVIELYWNIGKLMVEKQKFSEWGDKFVENLSKDLQKEFPEMEGFSATNLRRIKKFYLLYQVDTIQPQLAAELPWGHICILISIADKNKRDWYSKSILENNWPRGTLEQEIKAKLYERSGIMEKKVTNYSTHLPHPHGRLATEIIKSPYNLDFLGLHDAALEKEIEYGLVSHITKFLLELGKGFAFVGKQYQLPIGGQNYSIDLLFFNIPLNSYVVIEIKATPFKAEHTGQIALYISAIDKTVKQNNHNKTIGIILCKSNKNKLMAEYVLDIINAPIGISEYTLSKAIPENYKSNLPSIQELEEELNQFIMEEKYAEGK